MKSFCNDSGIRAMKKQTNERTNEKSETNRTAHTKTIARSTQISAHLFFLFDLVVPNQNDLRYPNVAISFTAKIQSHVPPWQICIPKAKQLSKRFGIFRARNFSFKYRQPPKTLFANENRFRTFRTNFSYFNITKWDLCLSLFFFYGDTIHKRL